MSAVVMESANTVTRPYRIATSDDLETYKPTIERLYADEHKTLQGVIHTMVERHGLKPTYGLQLLVQIRSTLTDA